MIPQSLLLTRAPEAGVEDLQTYRDAGGYDALKTSLASLTPPNIIQILAAAELRGRGGAAFPVSRKWELARAAESDVKYVVANGGEHEPGSRKDRLLISQFPHKVIEGLAIAAFATGAHAGYLYIIEDMADALASAQRAIADARAAGFLGSNILGSGFSFDIEIALAPPTYVAGEETAALEVIEGRKAWPRKKPPYPGQSGLFGKPTTINNVETLAAVPAILRHGPDYYKSLGVRGGAGTFLVTLDERVARPGVYEIPVGTPFREAIERFGAGVKSGRPIKAILPALSSRFLPAAALDTPMTPDAVRAAGSGLGCAGISFIEEGESIVPRVLQISQFFMKEQCGQCSACRMETNTLAMVMKNVAAGNGGEYAAQIDKIINFAKGKGYCSLIEMAAAPVQSALALFPEDFAAAAAGR
ncbi:MAG: SLBB domain-containing protein [Planctomycetes bacterium]|nr:SLBB domain-containing protein [Planctomycetota bacterium]